MGIFSSLLKIVKFVIVLKKVSKLDCSYCCPRSLLYNTEKFLKYFRIKIDKLLNDSNLIPFLVWLSEKLLH